MVFALSVKLYLQRLLSKLHRGGRDPSLQDFREKFAEIADKNCPAFVRRSALGERRATGRSLQRYSRQMQARCVCHDAEPVRDRASQSQPTSAQLPPSLPRLQCFRLWEN